MLAAGRTNNAALSAIVERCRASLDGLQQADNLKLKSSVSAQTAGVFTLDGISFWFRCKQTGIAV